ncbi:hypothetical protein E2C01_091976 [Portunus trituberculatus]|uniref:Uncharacterized protein n=1 Tax=Portunus trituberculatus TaxID=210409 RepID=A0A5B7JFD0_PORTR|nr:hypothetical protein [Portunus trituberculatus]
MNTVLTYLVIIFQIGGKDITKFSSPSENDLSDSEKTDDEKMMEWRDEVEKMTGRRWRRRRRKRGKKEIRGWKVYR